MTDLAKLKAILRRTAADGAFAARKEGFAGAEDGVARLLGHVDRAVLGRRLVFEFDNGARLVAEASGRRLIRLMPPAPAGLGADQAALFTGEEIRKDQVGALAAALLGLCEGRSGFRLTAEPLGDEVDPTEGGVTPAALLDALGLPSAPAEPDTVQDQVDGLFAALDPRLICAMSIDGEDAVLVRGEGDAAARLTDWASRMMDRLLAPDFPLAAALETDGIMVFGLPEAAGCHLVVAGRLGQIFVASVEGTDPSATLEAWRAIRG